MVKLTRRERQIRQKKKCCHAVEDKKALGPSRNPPIMGKAGHKANGITKEGRLARHTTDIKAEQALNRQGQSGRTRKSRQTQQENAPALLDNRSS